MLDRSQCLPMSMDASGPEPETTSNIYNRVCVRDVSWHSEVWSPPTFLYDSTH